MEPVEAIHPVPKGGSTVCPRITASPPILSGLYRILLFNRLRQAVLEIIAEHSKDFMVRDSLLKKEASQ